MKKLEKRLGRVHARQRLGIETDTGQRIFGKGLNFFHPENWYSMHALLKRILIISGLYARGKRNACNIQLRHNDLSIARLPPAFDGFTILHLSDLHVDMYPRATRALIECIARVDYDICVLTGDYRALTVGDIEHTLLGMQQVKAALSGPVYGVLGNHDSVTMVPGLEELGITMLLNESAVIEREGCFLYLAGIDDAHYFRVNNIEKAAQNIPHDAVSILLSHTPEIYRQAAHAQFSAMLCGHTHGGQICLPGGIALTLDANCPRFLGSGPWQYHQMVGYTSRGSGTSIVKARFNCLPEITLHRLRVLPDPR